MIRWTHLKTASVVVHALLISTVLLSLIVSANESVQQAEGQKAETQ